MHPRRFPLLLAILSSIAGAPFSARSQSFGIDDPSLGAHQLPPQFEAKAREMRNAPAQQYDFSKSNLGDVLRFLATDAHLSFISLPEETPEASKSITFSIHASPFSVLETLCKSNGLSLIPDENGNWYIRPADDRELIGRSYAIRYNAMEHVENTVGGGPGGGGAGGGGTIQSASVDLQGAKETFKVLPSELINDIRAILDLPPIQEGGTGAAPALVGAAGGADPSKAIAMTNSNQLSAMHQPKVIWKSDSNTLYVVATRLQHLWVAGYLEAADKPQPLIAIEVKFIETSKDPTKEFGIDWSGTLGQKGTFRQFDSLEYKDVSVTDPVTGKTSTYQQPTVGFTNVPNTDGGFRVDGNRLFTNPFDLGNIAKGIAWPNSALLTAQDLNIKLRAMLNDQETNTVSYPRMVTLNNREVVIRSVVNQPVLDGTSAISSGGGAATSSSITYLPIGTVLNILPKKMDADKVLLNVKITVSSIIGSQLISGNPYPIATSRVYNAPVVVNEGYTVAVGGLDEAKEKTTQSGVPTLSRVPILKSLFSSKSREKNHKNLMLFITPTLIDPTEGGLPAEPQSVVPLRPSNRLPRKPQLDTTGGLVGGADSIPESVSYLSRECDKIQTTIDESRQTEADSRKITDMRMALNKLEQQAEAMSAQHPEKADILTRATIDIQGLKERLGRMKMEMLKKAYY